MQAPMKKTALQPNPYNLPIKASASEALGSKNSENNPSMKNVKNSLFTGNSHRNIQRASNDKQGRISQSSVSVVDLEGAKKWDKEDDLTKASKDKSNSSSFFSSKAQLENQVERLATQLEVKTRELDQVMKIQEKRKSEIIELNKFINYQNGQIATKDQKLKQYESAFQKIAKQCDERSKYKSQVEELVRLFEDMRKENELFGAKYEEKSYQLNKLTQKYIKLKKRLQTKQGQNFSVDKNISRSNSLRVSPQVANRVFSPANDQKMSSSYLLNMQEKVKSIEASLKNMQEQNQALQKELSNKNGTICELSQYITNLKQSLGLKNAQQTDTPDNPSNKFARSSSSKKQGSIKRISYKKLFHCKPDPIHLILTKLKLAAMSHSIPHTTLCALLLSPAPALCIAPYSLSPSESQTLCGWLRSCPDPRLVLPQHLPPYPCSHQPLLRTIIANQYLNRQMEFLQYVEEQERVQLEVFEKYIKTWGLGQEHVNVLLQAYWEKMGDVAVVDLGRVAEIVRGWL